MHLARGTNISQGSVATRLRCGGIIDDRFIAIYCMGVPVKKTRRNLVNILMAYFSNHPVLCRRCCCCDCCQPDAME